MRTYLQGGVEFVGVEITLTTTVDGEPVTTPVSDGVQFAVVAAGTLLESATWVSPTSLDGEIGVMLTGDEVPGNYRLYAKITDDPEIPIVLCDEFNIAAA